MHAARARERASEGGRESARERARWANTLGCAPLRNKDTQCTHSESGFYGTFVWARHAQATARSWENTPGCALRIQRHTLHAAAILRSAAARAHVLCVPTPRRHCGAAPDAGVNCRDSYRKSCRLSVRKTADLLSERLRQFTRPLCSARPSRRRSPALFSFRTRLFRVRNELFSGAQGARGLAASSAAVVDVDLGEGIVYC
jgi:hypothetical protein